MHAERGKPMTIIPIACSAVACVLGVSVIAGWIFHVPALVQVLPDFAPMQFNTALCFLLSGTALFCRSINQKSASLGLSILVIVLTFLTLTQYVLGIELGIDQLVIDPYITTKTTHPGRMAPNTAACFLLLGLAIAFESTNVFERRYTEMLFISEMLSPLILAISTMSLFGYVFQNETAVAWANLTGMALHTTIGMLFLGVGLSVFT